MVYARPKNVLHTTTCKKSPSPFFCYLFEDYSTDTIKLQTCDAYNQNRSVKFNQMTTQNKPNKSTSQRIYFSSANDKTERRLVLGYNPKQCMNII